MEYAFCSPEITELSKALIAVQKDLKPALKDAVNPFVHNSYASLGSIMDACRNALIEHDVLLTQYPVPVEGEYLGLVTKLVHAKSGQYQASLAVIPLAKHDPQAMGSAITYGRRYALSAMLGIVPEEDDDGNAACNIMDSSPKRRTPHSAGASRKQATAPVQAKAQSRPSLSTLLADLGLAELLPGILARPVWLCSRQASPRSLQRAKKPPGTLQKRTSYFTQLYADSAQLQVNTKLLVL